MKHLRQIFVLWVFWVVPLWLMAPCLDLRPESAPQGKLMVLVPWHCNHPWLQLRTSGCQSEMLNSSLWHHRAGERTGFAARYEKTVEYLMRTTESLTPNSVLWYLGMNSENGLGKMWEKLFKVTPSVSHFHLYCGTCALVGNPKTLQASGLSHNVNRYPTVFGNASIQGSWRQLVLLLKLSGLVWTSDDPSGEILEGGPVP
uniref:Chromosome 20 open reading frame 173 n=1 Tax=Neovison vison TaxID=452646 RepID=A0A8C7B663_NEOVI